MAYDSIHGDFYCNPVLVVFLFRHQLIFVFCLHELHDCVDFVLCDCVHVDIATGDCIVGWHAHMGQVYSISFTHDENSLYSLGHDGKVSD